MNDADDDYANDVDNDDDDVDNDVDDVDNGHDDGTADDDNVDDDHDNDVDDDDDDDDDDNDNDNSCIETEGKPLKQKQILNRNFRKESDIKRNGVKPVQRAWRFRSGLLCYSALL